MNKAARKIKQLGQLCQLGKIKLITLHFKNEAAYISKFQINDIRPLLGKKEYSRFSFLKIDFKLPNMFEPSQTFFIYVLITRKVAFSTPA